MGLTGHNNPQLSEWRGSVADPTDNSKRQPLRLRMATGTLDSFGAAAPSKHGETTPAYNMDLTKPGLIFMGGRHDEIADQIRPHNEERLWLKDDWQTVLTVRQKKQPARECNRGTDSMGCTSPTKPHQRQRGTPKLPKEYFKIVVRTHQGLPFKTISTTALAIAIVTACNFPIRSEQLSLLKNPGSKVTILSTSSQTLCKWPAKSVSSQSTSVHMQSIYTLPLKRTLFGELYIDFHPKRRQKSLGLICVYELKASNSSTRE
ncbi:hypothetical protein HPB51_007640 [Rhipicephalus microplus]|uniref:Uncharacterized protein n=1 Tax=Rhipicephalus microplus TaxID=6941 RepID=A0A9J6ER23_RHIMP|nr:hypothetical protein HPB51_007640 [Rhipicephalus microplus]